MRTRQPSHPGYVLLLTLVVLALAAVSLVSVGRLSLQRAREAVGAQQELRRRWALLSCRETLLPQAPRLLLEAEARSVEPVALLHARLELAGETYDLFISDEQAKLNLNSLFDPARPEQVENQIRALCRETSTITGQLKLRPSISPYRTLGPSTHFGGWGQVFAKPDPASLFPKEGQDGYALADITCWGDGRINLRRASPAALQTACGSILADTSALLNLRRQIPGLDVATITQELELDGRQEALLRDRLTVGSNCFALWAVARSKDGRRAYHELAVLDRSAPIGSQELSFSW